MQKIRIKELPVFPSVAAVLGKAEAERQLFIAISGYLLQGEFPSKEGGYNLLMKNTWLVSAFRWDSTPQGWEYWADINNKIDELGENGE